MLLQVGVQLLFEGEDFTTHITLNLLWSIKLHVSGQVRPLSEGLVAHIAFVPLPLHV